MYANFEAEFQKLLDVAKSNLPDQARTLLDPQQLRAFVLKGFGTKKPLKEMLGLGEDYRKRWTIESRQIDRQSHEYSALITLIGQCLSLPPENSSARAALGEEDLKRRVFQVSPSGVYVAVGSGETLDRVIADNKITVGGRVLKFSRWALGVLKAEDWAQVRQLNYRSGPFTGPEHLFSKLFEKVASTRRDVMLSCNPLDMLLPSDCCDYTSCYKLSGGQYTNGALAYINDAFTLISASMEAGKHLAYPFRKQGRAWVYLEPVTYERFVVGKRYGNFTDEQIDALFDHLAGLLCARAGKEYSMAEWHKRSYCTIPRSHNSYANVNSGGNAIYFDEEVSRLGLARYVLDRAVAAAVDNARPVDLLPPFKFSAATCLGCGAKTTHANFWLCYDCKTAGAKCAGGCGKTLNAKTKGIKSESRPSSGYYTVTGYKYTCASCVKAEQARAEEARKHAEREKLKKEAADLGKSLGLVVAGIDDDALDFAQLEGKVKEMKSQAARIRREEPVNDDAPAPRPRLRNPDGTFRKRTPEDDAAEASKGKEPKKAKRANKIKEAIESGKLQPASIAWEGDVWTTAPVMEPTAF